MVSKYLIFILAYFCITSACFAGINDRNRLKYRRVFKKSYSHRGQKIKNSAKNLYLSSKSKSNIHSRINSLKQYISLYSNHKYAEAAYIEIIDKYFLLGEYKKTLFEFRGFLNQYPESKFIDKAYYYAGLSYLELFDKPNALLCFDKIIYEIGKKSDFYFKAFMSKGDIYFKFKNYKEALKYYNKTKTMIKSSSSISSLIYYKIGKTYQKLGRWNKAKESFNIIIKKYPLSNEIDLIKQSLSELKDNYFSLQLGSFGSENNAYRLHKKMHKKGYDVFVLSPQESNDKFYKVRVGHFDTRNQAIKMHKTIKIREKIIGKIVP